MSDLIEREYLLNIARQDGAYGYVSEHEILNAPNAETTGALDDAIQEYIKDGYILAEPKVGKWVAVTNGRGGHECSECHEYAPSYQNGREHLTDYCPNCGAKMEGASDVITKRNV